MDLTSATEAPPLLPTHCLRCPFRHCGSRRRKDGFPTFHAWVRHLQKCHGAFSDINMGGILTLESIVMLAMLFCANKGILEGKEVGVLVMYDCMGVGREYIRECRFVEYGDMGMEATLESVRRLEKDRDATKRRADGRGRRWKADKAIAAKDTPRKTTARKTTTALPSTIQTTPASNGKNGHPIQQIATHHDAAEDDDDEVYFDAEEYLDDTAEPFNTAQPEEFILSRITEVSTSLEFHMEQARATHRLLQELRQLREAIEMKRKFPRGEE